jgi:tetratricopeptide (TPR) repeat protein
MTGGAASRRDADLTLAMQCHAAGRFGEAEVIYQRLHLADRRDTEVIYLMGMLCCDLGMFDAACRFLDEALALSPAFPEARAQLAVALIGQATAKCGSAEWAGAEECLVRALALAPDDAQTLNSLGLAQLQQEKFAAAESSLTRALQLQPDLNQARNNLGLALYSQARLADARRCFEAALAQDPSYRNARLNLANTLRILGQPDGARSELKTLLADHADAIDVLNNMGAVLQDLGESELALDFLTRAAALSPEAPQVRWNLALTQLQRGDFSNGWSNFESRWDGCGHLRGGYMLPRERAWRGEPLQGKRLLVWAEQGFGDTIQFARFARDVALRGATVTMLVPPELEDLMRHVPGVSEVAVQDGAVPEYDFQSPLMSLPYLLGISLDTSTLHGSTPYLHAAAADIAHWRGRLRGYAGLKVGLVWKGSARRQSAELAAIDARRSIPLETLSPLLAVPGCSFFSLQKDAASTAVDPAGVIQDFSAEWRNFSDTAGFIANLDLVISVDTAVAHLAGALGKPVWLLNRFDACWRWLLGRSDSPWYSTLRQFRQAGFGEWGPVVATAAEALADVVARANAAEHAETVVLDR